jgi:hypothetical protein
LLTCGRSCLPFIHEQVQAVRHGSAAAVPGSNAERDDDRLQAAALKTKSQLKRERLQTRRK